MTSDEALHYQVTRVKGSALRSVTELGAWRDITRDLIVAGGDARPVQVAEVTANAFRVADNTPLLGRVLVADDERAAAHD